MYLFRVFYTLYVRYICGHITIKEKLCNWCCCFFIHTILPFLGLGHTSPNLLLNPHCFEDQILQSIFFLVCAEMLCIKKFLLCLFSLPLPFKLSEQVSSLQMGTWYLHLAMPSSFSMLHSWWDLTLANLRGDLGKLFLALYIAFLLPSSDMGIDVMGVYRLCLSWFGRCFSLDAFSLSIFFSYSPFLLWR